MKFYTICHGILYNFIDKYSNIPWNFYNFQCTMNFSTMCHGILYNFIENNSQKNIIPTNLQNFLAIYSISYQFIQFPTKCSPNLQNLIPIYSISCQFIQFPPKCSPILKKVTKLIEFDTYLEYFIPIYTISYKMFTNFKNILQFIEFSNNLQYFLPIYYNYLLFSSISTNVHKLH